MFFGGGGDDDYSTFGQWQRCREQAEGVVCLDARFYFLICSSTSGLYLAQVACRGADWPVFQHSRQAHQWGTVGPQGHGSWQLPFASVARVFLPEQHWLWLTAPP